jgi:hypothetical protein
MFILLGMFNCDAKKIFHINNVCTQDLFLEMVLAFLDIRLSHQAIQAIPLTMVALFYILPFQEAQRRLTISVK